MSPTDKPEPDRGAGFSSRGAEKPPAPDRPARPTVSRPARVILIVSAVVIFFAGLYGFGSKFEELIHTVRSDQVGSFALIPILNYMLATAGFICLFIWAARNGMFKDIEKPKHDMLERERRLDQEDGHGWEE